MSAPNARLSSRGGNGSLFGTAEQGNDGSDGKFHAIRHFESGLPLERFRRGLPPGYTGFVPMHADHDRPPAAYKLAGGPPPPVAYNGVTPRRGSSRDHVGRTAVRI